MSNSAAGTVVTVWFIVPRTATDGYPGQGGPAWGFLAKLAHTLCMYLLSVISKAVALGGVGRLPKMRGTVLDLTSLAKDF